jgi:predicted Zn-dependent protease with MMP-like domain
MYPLPRMLITVALFVALGYGLLALIFLPPTRVGLIVYYVGLPTVIALGIAIFSRGEPSDQTAIHVPRTMSDAEFDTLENRVDRLGREGLSGDDAQARDDRNTATFDPAHNEQDFIELVGQAIDELPSQFAQALEHVGVVVSDQGAVQRLNGRHQPLYGLYVGYGGRGSYLMGAPVRNALPDRIVIFRDTLTHDYGNDPNRLRQEVTRTLRHELAHHLGWDETGVRDLGL